MVGSQMPDGLTSGGEEGEWHVSVQVASRSLMSLDVSLHLDHVCMVAAKWERFSYVTA
jgi:hypothetical protein